MTGYFSFNKMITAQFVKAVYLLGFIVLTAGGIGLAVWAGMRLQWGTVPTRLGEYYIAAGVAAAVVVGNLVWRVFCENWILLFNMHQLLASIERAAKPVVFEPEVKPVEVAKEEKATTVEPERPQLSTTRKASVLGLSW